MAGVGRAAPASLMARWHYIAESANRAEVIRAGAIACQERASDSTARGCHSGNVAYERLISGLEAIDSEGRLS
jgi:hypothetical protein